MQKRLTTGITDYVQEQLQLAADSVGATLNQFVVQAALEKAKKVIDSQSTIVLTRRESLKLLELIENPPPIKARRYILHDRIPGNCSLLGSGDFCRTITPSVFLGLSLIAIELDELREVNIHTKSFFNGF